MKDAKLFAVRALTWPVFFAAGLVVVMMAAGILILQPGQPGRAEQ
jgi:hypothetical protein